MSELFLLSERQMARISPFFLRSHGVARVDDRRVLSGIIYVIRNGLQWKDAPKAYGPHKTYTIALYDGACLACSTASSWRWPRRVGSRSGS